MPKVKAFNLITHNVNITDKGELAKFVPIINKELEKGWQPQGGMMPFQHGTQITLVLPMVMYEDEEESAKE